MRLVKGIIGGSRGWSRDGEGLGWELRFGEKDILEVC